MLALVTGGSAGIGREYARQLACRGYDLLIVSNREDELQEAAASLAADCKVSVTPMCMDLSLPDAADRLHDHCTAEGLQVDVLINNAGIFFFKELDSSMIDKASLMIRLHVNTVTRLTCLFGEDMKKRGSGHILNMASMAADLPLPGISIYSATKAYLKSFGKSMSHELRPYGVRITTVCPAAIATPLYNLRGDLIRLGMRLTVIKSPEWLVRRALRALAHGRAICKPGLMNIYAPLGVALLPNWLIRKVWTRFKP